MLIQYIVRKLQMHYTLPPLLHQGIECIEGQNRAIPAKGRVQIVLNDL
jgi:hypothetical protein